MDHSEEHWEEYPSLNTTRNVLNRIKDLDLVLHIGDISYAVGYSAQVPNGDVVSDSCGLLLDLMLIL